MRENFRKNKGRKYISGSEISLHRVFSEDERFTLSNAGSESRGRPRFGKNGGRFSKGGKVAFPKIAFGKFSMTWFPISECGFNKIGMTNECMLNRC